MIDMIAHQSLFMAIKMFVFSLCLAFEKIKVSNAIILQFFLAFVTTPSFGIRPNCTLIATKMNRRWICNDVWMDIFPSFDRPQLGLKLALLSPRFDALVDKHFDKSELTIWKRFAIYKDKGPEPKLSVLFKTNATFPLPNCPLPSKIRFKHLRIDYIDHSVIAFLRLNQQIFDKRGTNLHLWIPSSHTIDGQRIWDIFVREIWPIFSTSIRHLGFNDGDHLENLRRLISPTILTGLNQLSSIYSGDLFPEAIGTNFDGPNAKISAGQALSKWLHSPRKDGQPKRLRCADYKKLVDFDWVNNFKEHFLRANAISSVSYEIHFYVHAPSMQMVPFELVNEWTKEKLTLAKTNELGNNWIMKRCKIIEETAMVQQHKEGDWNNVLFWLFSSTNCIGPLSPSPEEETGQSITNGPSSDNE